MTAVARTSSQKARRLEALYHYGVLDTEPEPAFDRIVGLAQRLFKVPIVLVRLVAEDGQWFNAGYGLDLRETGLDVSFCAHATGRDGVMVVPDTHDDSRFRENPLVTGEPGIRFYAGAPLKTPDGYNLGTLCLLDTVPHAGLSGEAIATLTDLAAMVVDELELRHASQQTERQVRQLETVFESITDAFYLLDPSWRFTYLNPQAELLLKRSKEELLGRELWSAFPETVNSVLHENFLRAARTGTSAAFEYFFAPLAAWFEVRAYPSDRGLSVYFQNISERKDAERRTRVHAEFHRSLLALTQAALQTGRNDGFYQALLEQAVKTIPGAQAGSLLIRRTDGHHFVAAVGFDLDALSRCTFGPADFLFDLYSPEPQFIYNWQVAELDASRRGIMETHGLSSEIAVSLCVPVLVDNEPYLSLYLDNFNTPDAFDEEAVAMTRVLAQQVAALMQRQELEEALLREQSALGQLAHYDPATNLPNRRRFDDRLKQAASQSRRTGKPLAAMFLDLDNFKDVNDTYGHAFGDALLREVAGRLGQSVREGDTVARWGGDEFVVMVPEFREVSEVESLAGRLLEALRQPFLVDGREVRTTVTIGVATSDGASASADDLVKNADIALYRAKAARGSYVLFTRQMKEQLHLRVELGGELRAALAANKLTLNYQPRVALSSGKVTSLEALARWPHPTKGWVPPSTFIPLAEELGLIRELGAQLLDLACAQAKAWQEAGLAQRVAVNVSAEQLRYPHIVEEVRSTLARHGLNPALLELEVTESTAMADIEGGTARLQQLRELGVHLAIDDFGTAYSSLAYLKQLPVHSLKIDRAFINGLGGPGVTGEANIVQAIVALARSFGLSVVAEGVENERQRLALCALGCEEAQGYLFAKPLPPGEVTELLKASRTASPPVALAS